MTYKLSKRSLAKLEGVRPDLVETVSLAIKLTRVDFGVTCGFEDFEQQKSWLRMDVAKQ